MPPRVGGPRGQMRAPMHKAKKGTLKRLLSLLFTQNKKLLIAVLCCIVFAAITSVSSSFFLKWLVDTLQSALYSINTLGLSPSSAWQKILPDLLTLFLVMGGVFLLSVVSSFTYTRLMAIVTQRFLHQTRTMVFNKMQSLPIRFFDTHRTGDIMSVYTNDIDALRQLVSQSLPSLCTSLISVTTLVVLMFTYSLWLMGIMITLSIAV